MIAGYVIQPCNAIQIGQHRLADFHEKLSFRLFALILTHFFRRVIRLTSAVFLRCI